MDLEGETQAHWICRTAMNLVLAFAIAVKHNLRFEPDIAYTDLVGLVGHLDTFAKEAHDPNVAHPRKLRPWKKAAEYLGVSFAESNPRKYIKRAKKPLGHLSLEILNHLSAYIDYCTDNKTLSSAVHNSQLSEYQNYLNGEISRGAFC
jgi:putative membrane protein